MPKAITILILICSLLVFTGCDRKSNWCRKHGDGAAVCMDDNNLALAQRNDARTDLKRVIEGYEKILVEQEKTYKLELASLQKRLMKLQSIMHVEQKKEK